MEDLTKYLENYRVTRVEENFPSVFGSDNEDTEIKDAVLQIPDSLEDVSSFIPSISNIHDQASATMTAFTTAFNKDIDDFEALVVTSRSRARDTVESLKAATTGSELWDGLAAALVEYHNSIVTKTVSALLKAVDDSIQTAEPHYFRVKVGFGEKLSFSLAPESLTSSVNAGLQKLAALIGKSALTDITLEVSKDENGGSMEKEKKEPMSEGKVETNGDKKHSGDIVSEGTAANIPGASDDLPDDAGFVSVQRALSIVIEAYKGFINTLDMWRELHEIDRSEFKRRYLLMKPSPANLVQDIKRYSEVKAMTEKMDKPQVFFPIMFEAHGFFVKMAELGEAWRAMVYDIVCERADQVFATISKSVDDIVQKASDLNPGFYREVLKAEDEVLGFKGQMTSLPDIETQKSFILILKKPKMTNGRTAQLNTLVQNGIDKLDAILRELDAKKIDLKQKFQQEVDEFVEKSIYTLSEIRCKAPFACNTDAGVVTAQHLVASINKLHDARNKLSATASSTATPYDSSKLTSLALSACQEDLRCLENIWKHIGIWQSKWNEWCTKPLAELNQDEMLKEAQAMKDNIQNLFAPAVSGAGWYPPPPPWTCLTSLHHQLDMALKALAVMHRCNDKDTSNIHLFGSHGKMMQFS